MNELWDIARVSQYLGMKRSTLYAMIERKEIPYYRIGRLARFRQAEIDAWLVTKKQETKKAVTMTKPTGVSLSPVSIVNAAIDEVNPDRYNRLGKSDRIKGLRKEG